MRVFRRGISTLVLTLTPLACGGGSENYVMISHAVDQASRSPRPLPEAPEATVQQAKDCLSQYAARLSERSYAIQYQFGMNDEGKILQVNLKDSTLHDSEIEGCFRAVIGAMKIPKEALELRSSGPVSGGERMTREQRGPMGSESESPLIFLGPMIVEAVGIEVIIQVGVGIIAAVATLVDTTEKNPKDECQEHFSDCLTSPLASRMGSVHGNRMCLWCRDACVSNNGKWVSRVPAIGKPTRSCEYWK